MSDDWLGESVPALPIPIELPIDPAARVALAEQCWASLTDKQRTWLTAYRENRLNSRRTESKGAGDRRTHYNWERTNRNYATVVRLWRGAVGSQALDKDRLLARQDDIVETLLTPKPILYQGDHTGFEEVEAAAASRANEVLMKSAGLLKDKDLDINVGIIGPSLQIQVVQSDGSVRELAQQGVAVDLEEPIDAEFEEIPDDDGWLDGP